VGAAVSSMPNAGTVISGTADVRVVYVAVWAVVTVVVVVTLVAVVAVVAVVGCVSRAVADLTPASSAAVRPWPAAAVVRPRARTVFA
jgi:hypothetical protein